MGESCDVTIGFWGRRNRLEDVDAFVTSCLDKHSFVDWRGEDYGITTPERSWLCVDRSVIHDNLPLYQPYRERVLRAAEKLEITADVKKRWEGMPLLLIWGESNWRLPISIVVKLARRYPDLMLEAWGSTFGISEEWLWAYDDELISLWYWNGEGTVYVDGEKVPFEGEHPKPYMPFGEMPDW